MIRGEALETSLTLPGRRRVFCLVIPYAFRLGGLMPERHRINRPISGTATDALATRKTLRKQGRDAMRNCHARTSSRRNFFRGFRRLLIPLAALALTGCAGHVRYVSVYCLTPPQYQKLKDAEPGKVGSKLTGNAQDDLKTIAGSAIELRQYDGDLLNVLGGCVGPGK